MATILARRVDALLRARTFMVLCALLALLLPAAWVAVGTYVLRTRVVQEMGDAAATARLNFDGLFGRISKTTALFSAADARATNRISLAARMLRIEAGLAPAESLFLYDASGHFVAATVPLLPGEEVVRRTAWFRTVEAGSRTGGLVLFGPARQPLGEGRGFVIARRLVVPGGTFSGAVGTFLSLTSIRQILESSALPPRTAVELRSPERAGAVLQFSVPGAKHHGAFESQLAGMAPVPAVSASVALPGGFEWHATANAFSAMTAAEARAIFWGATLLAAGPLLLLAALGLTCRDGQRPPGEIEVPSPTARNPEPDWMWEINAEGLLVGVAGNAPRPLVEAVGSSLFDLVADDARSRELRDAMARRLPLRDVTLRLVLAGAATGAPRRFSVSGFPVQVTGGFWGTAREVSATTESGDGFADPQPADLVAAVQAGAVSASAPSMRPSSVLPRRFASALRCAASM
ncbi:MAG: PDC sensor domain-containing protein [Acetobacteraceae bacterium]